MENNVKSRIENATLIDDTTFDQSGNLKINIFFYIIGLLLMFTAYVGPYLYYKFYKKKNFVIHTNIGVKHAI